MRPAKKECKLITFEGINYRRYPGDLYYRANGTGKKLGKGNLHQEIWKAHNGPIPEGMEIHHKDANTDNNDISNLECLTFEEHKARHVGREASPRQLKHLASIRPLTIEWHKSEDGRAWHSLHGKRVWESRVPGTKVCECCGKPYETLKPTGSQYCSNACKTRARRLSGVDNVSFTCLFCGERFTDNKYSKRTFCTRRCSSRYMHANKAHPPTH